MSPGSPSPRSGGGLSAEQRLAWLRLIRSENIGPVGIMAQTPQANRTGRTLLTEENRELGERQGVTSRSLGRNCAK